MKSYHYLLITSFILEGIFSNFISINTPILSPLFLLVTLIFMYPNFKDDKNYYKACLIYGVAYDIIYTNNLIFHGLLFFFVCYIIKFLYKRFLLNILNTILISILAIIIYRLLGYTLLCLVSSYNFSWITLLNSITSSLLLNIIYIVILYMTLNHRYHYYKLKKG